MKIKIGQVFRVTRSQQEISPAGNIYSNNYIELTRGSKVSPADIQKGIWAYKDVSEHGQHFKRIPAIILHSNPFKEGTEITPWIDVVEPDLGYALYNGDNRKGSLLPLQSRGNAILSRAQVFYADP